MSAPTPEKFRRSDTAHSASTLAAGEALARHLYCCHSALCCAVLGLCIVACGCCFAVCACALSVVYAEVAGQQPLPPVVSDAASVPAAVHQPLSPVVVELAPVLDVAPAALDAACDAAPDSSTVPEETVTVGEETYAAALEVETQVACLPHVVPHSPPRVTPHTPHHPHTHTHIVPTPTPLIYTNHMPHSSPTHPHVTHTQSTPTPCTLLVSHQTVVQIIQCISVHPPVAKPACPAHTQLYVSHLTYTHLCHHLITRACFPPCAHSHSHHVRACLPVCCCVCTQLSLCV